MVRNVDIHITHDENDFDPTLYIAGSYHILKRDEIIRLRNTCDHYLVKTGPDQIPGTKSCNNCRQTCSDRGTSRTIFCQSWKPERSLQEQIEQMRQFVPVHMDTHGNLNAEILELQKKVKALEGANEARQKTIELLCKTIENLGKK